MKPAVRRILLGRANVLPKWRAAKARVFGGAGSAVICCVGDSKTFGRGANGADYTGAKVKAYPRRLAEFLTAAGVSARECSHMGTGRAGVANFLLSDSRVAAGVGWAEFTSDGFGGYMLWNNTDLTTLSFTPTETFDTIEIFDATSTGQGTWTVNVDGGAALATVAATPTALRKTTVSCARGTHTINIQRNGTGTYIIIPSIVVKDSQAKCVYVHNMGASGSQASQWNVSANVWSPLNGITALAPDLTIINLGTNEWLNLTSAATFKTNMAGIIAVAKAAGDVLLIAPSLSSTASASQDTQAGIIAACYQLATEQGVPILDESLLWGLFTAGNAAGYYFDNVHESGLGYEIEARSIAAYLLAR